MLRIFHPYTSWEEHHAGMWENVHSSEFTNFLQKAIEFTGNAELYGSWMIRVITEWPISCEHNLTDTSINRKAWIGHAATCLAIKCPEHITRLAWGRLSQEQQDAANLKAQEAIDLWGSMHEAKNNQVCEAMGVSGIPERNTRGSAAKAGSLKQGSFLSDDLQSNS